MGRKGIEAVYRKEIETGAGGGRIGHGKKSVSERGGGRIGHGKRSESERGSERSGQANDLEVEAIQRQRQLVALVARQFLS